ncbi:hypothetical protein ScPMuIL_012937 [Solemya velum]
MNHTRPVMSWFPETRTNQTWAHRLCTWILKSGPVPKHVAIIMDGNRRFALKNSMQRAEGHLKGFDKLAEVLDWCLNLGITEVTVYAFSIENFKRSKDEVDCLMELARQKFARLLQEKEQIMKHGVCIRVLGDLSLLPRDILEELAESVECSKNNTRAVLNVCFAYTSRDEITTGIKKLAEGVDKGLIRQSDISEELLEKCLSTHRSADPDLMIRTSGEVRLSDFLLWQSTFTCLAFVKVLWPEFSLWHLYAAILHYQKNYDAISNARENNRIEIERRQRDSDYRCVMEEQKQKSGEDGVNLQTQIISYSKEREKRIVKFLTYLDYKEETFFNNILSNKPVACNS